MKIIQIAPAALLMTTLFYACGDISSGRVALYVTDDLGDYKQVVTTLETVELRHTGSGESCSLLDEPTTLDLAMLGLKSVLELVNVADCPSRSYNRFHIAFQREVVLTNKDGVTATCSFDSYKDEHSRPNALACDGDICSLDITGAVNVAADENTDVALDFDLKEFEVKPDTIDPTQPCTVTMKVTPLHGKDMEDKENEGYHRSLEGRISGLDTATKTFIIRYHEHDINVNYASIEQDGIDTLLQQAQDDELEVELKCTELDLNTSKCAAKSIHVELKGHISDLNPDTSTFTLYYQTDKSLGVDYSLALVENDGENHVEGVLAEGSRVEVELVGHNGTDFLAIEVELEETEDMIHEDNKETGETVS